MLRQLSFNVSRVSAACLQEAIKFAPLVVPCSSSELVLVVIPRVLKYQLPSENFPAAASRPHSIALIADTGDTIIQSMCNETRDS